jgi:hypothetical protein
MSGWGLNRYCSDQVEDFRFATESDVATNCCNHAIYCGHVHTLAEFWGVGLRTVRSTDTLKSGMLSPLPVSISMLSARATGSLRSAVTADALATLSYAD